jgi:acyl-CoA reductase-like NAD-dependent aldehyde dehydrogenase
MTSTQASSQTPDLSFARELRQSWIDGRAWTDAAGAMAHLNPADGQSLGDTETVEAAGVDAAVAAARRAFNGAWGTLPARQRSGLLLAFAQRIEANIDQLALLEAIEVGRPLADARMVIGMAPDMIRRYAAMIDRVQGDVIAGEARQLSLSWRRARGVVAAIVPWNFPVMNVVVRLAPALAAGNAVIVKPSENSPRSALLMARLASEAGLPDGTFNVVLGLGSVTGEALAAHPDVDLVTFTGSTQTGLRVTRAAAATTLKPVLMECGGKSPQIVLEDILDDPAIWHPIFFSSFWNSGQWCAARTRLLVPSFKIDQAVEGLQQAAKAWRVGDPLREGTMLGPIVNTIQLDRVRGYLDAAAQAGQVVELGCPREGLHPEGNFLVPSVALDQPRGSRVTREEIFGPVITIEGFDDVDDAIGLANDTSYGLMASVWTRQSDLGHRLARNVVAGAISIYSSAEAASRSMPDYVGGYLEPQKQSGHGVDGGVPGLAAYTTAQSITWMH